tara:strand:- start:54 stop:1940 length:1887 start_codon:yes stop_codon:yes gene_type:complete
MGAVVEVKYFNTFILKKTTEDNVPVWNGSYGIPSELGGYSRVVSSSPYNWAIEESRIRGGYNNTTVDFGVKAYIVEDERLGSYRKSSLIYSGIFNSRTGINQTNVFSVGEDITKTADPANASIQKLYAEDTNLIIFQENKVSRALIDKDAIYSAEGGGSVTSSNLVIGVIQPYSGEYGISKNPESFAIYGYSKYFSDKNNNAILRLSQNGIEEISRYGMRDYFRDRINDIDTVQGEGIILGGYDLHNNQYVVSSQLNPIRSTTSTEVPGTLSFDEQARGWVSFFTFNPEQIFSLKNNFYTIKDGGVWEHYAGTRGNFYGVDRPSSVTVVFNAAPANSKTFNTVSYEGNNGWSLTSLVSDPTGLDTQPKVNWASSEDSTMQVTPSTTYPSLYSYYEGEYIETSSTATVTQTGVGTSVVIANTIPVIDGAIVSGIGVGLGVTVVSYAGIQGQASSDSAGTSVTLTGVSVDIPVGTIISGDGIVAGTTVASYDSGTGVLVASNTLAINQSSFVNFVNIGILTVSASANFVINSILTFVSIVNRVDYETVFGTGNPPYPVSHAGFNRKENKYVGNLRNFSTANDSEVIWGESISGVKGFYSIAQFSTDTTTDPGGNKQLFSVESSYIINNGY